MFTNSTVGGKALHLAEMIAHGKIAGVDLIKIPAASVVTTAAYDAHVAALGGLEELLDMTLEVGDTSQLEKSAPPSKVPVAMTNFCKLASTSIWNHALPPRTDLLFAPRPQQKTKGLLRLQGSMRRTLTCRVVRF